MVVIYEGNTFVDFDTFKAYEAGPELNFYDFVEVLAEEDRFTLVGSWADNPNISSDEKSALDFYTHKRVVLQFVRKILSCRTL